MSTKIIHAFAEDCVFMMGFVDYRDTCMNYWWAQLSFINQDVRKKLCNLENVTFLVVFLIKCCMEISVCSKLFRSYT